MQQSFLFHCGRPILKTKWSQSSHRQCRVLVWTELPPSLDRFRTLHIRRRREQCSWSHSWWQSKELLWSCFSWLGRDRLLLASHSFDSLPHKKSRQSFLAAPETASSHLLSLWRPWSKRVGCFLTGILLDRGTQNSLIFGRLTLLAPLRLPSNHHQVFSRKHCWEQCNYQIRVRKWDNPDLWSQWEIVASLEEERGGGVEFFENKSVVDTGEQEREFDRTSKNLVRRRGWWSGREQCFCLWMCSYW